jgi:PAS domain S-box-containing protein
MALTRMQSGDYLLFTLVALAIFGGVALWLAGKQPRARLPRAFWLMLLALLPVGFFYVEASGRRPQQRLMALLEGIAPTYADELSRMGHADLRLDGALDDPRYLAMIETLKRWVMLNPLVSDIYTFRRLANGDIVIMVDAETDYDGDGVFVGERELRTRPGEPYPQAGPELRRAFEGERTFLTHPVTDRWGTWVSAHVPMLDRQGRVEAVLGLDYHAKSCQAENAERRLVALGYLGVVLIILLGSGTAIAVYRAELVARIGAEGKLRASLAEVERENAERRAAEQARRAADARLELHMQQTPLAYVEWSPDMRIMRWNPAAERIFGFTSAEVLGQSFVGFIVPAPARPEVEAVCARLATSRVPVHHSNENCTKDGRVIVCEWHNTPLIGADGTLLAVASHAQDITERVRIEQHLRQAQKLESMGQLAGGVAHEFNNLLTPMLMQMGQIQATYEHDSRLLELLRPVEESIMQAAQLNQRILAVGRRQSENRTLGDLNQMVATALDLLRHTLDRRIELAVDLSPGLPPALLSRGAVVQVMMNLALNARDSLLARLAEERSSAWTPQITVTTRLSAPPSGGPPGLRAAPACLRLEISDNGQGMGVELQRRAFEPFFTTKPPGQGTGLGLAVVWSVVEGLGGHIDLLSNPGEGARFSIFLPAAWPGEAPAAAAEEPGRTRSPRAARALRILLVEDNALVRETVADVLRLDGHAVDVASDGEAGLGLLQATEARPYDLLVTDVNLPRLSGRELLQRIRGRGLARGVLVVSGLLDPRLGAELRELGADRVVSKPIGMEDLLSAVNAVGSRSPIPGGAS